MNPTEIPQGTEPIGSISCVELEAKRSPTPYDPVSKVLDDNNLLVEIMVHLGFPTSLFRAALVCRRWFHHISDPTFIRRFRKLHPPRILGFYTNNDMSSTCSCFVPMLPHPPDLGTVIRRASFSLDTWNNPYKFVMECWNGYVLINSLKNYDKEPEAISIVLSPLCPERGIVILPRFPRQSSLDNSICWLRQLLFKEGAGLSYMFAVF